MNETDRENQTTTTRQGLSPAVALFALLSYSARDAFAEIQAITGKCKDAKDGEAMLLAVLDKLHDAGVEKCGSAVITHRLRGTDQTAMGYYEAVTALRSDMRANDSDQATASGKRR